MYLAQTERQLEHKRQALCLYVDFTPEAAFKRLDRHCKDRLTSVELTHFLMEHDSEGVAEYEVRRVLRYYDSDNDGVLNLNE